MQMLPRNDDENLRQSVTCEIGSRSHLFALIVVFGYGVEILVGIDGNGKALALFEFLVILFLFIFDWRIRYTNGYRTATSMVSPVAILFKTRC